MKKRIELFWTVWPSDVATVNQIRLLTGARNTQQLSRHMTNVTEHRVYLNGVQSRVVCRPGTEYRGSNMTKDCQEAGEAVGLGGATRPESPDDAKAALDRWPANVATVAQLRHYLQDNRRGGEFTGTLAYCGAQVLTARVKLPGESARSFVVLLRGELPAPTVREYRFGKNEYVSDPEHYLKLLQRRDQMFQCAKLAAQAGEMLTGEPGNYYPTNGIA